VTLADLLALAEIEPGRYRSSLRHGGFTSLFGEATTLYGGQQLALSLAAAARTVDEEWSPMSLTCAFLRGGRPDEVIDYVVRTVRDGRTVAQRTVDAYQDERHLSTALIAFCADVAGVAGPDTQDVVLPDCAAPAGLPPMSAAHLIGVEARVPEQPRPGPWPTRYWARGTGRLPDVPAVDACTLAYVSDTCTPLFPSDGGHHGPTMSHSIWFHRRLDAGEWFLIDLVPRSTAGGIGHYLGSAFDPAGRLVATLAQEAVYRWARPGPGN
jgi:acyl-CoA thioesterase-2